MGSKNIDKNLTIFDIAALAGVSYQTVSRVINGKPHVADSTRERIKTILGEVGFRPNITAQHLARRRSTTVGLVAFATNFYGPSQILVRCEQSAKELGLSFMFSGIVEQSQDEIRRAVNELCAHQICGILIHLPSDVDLRDLREICRNVPFVAVDSDFGFKCPSVFVNQKLGSKIATRYLISLGHHKIACLRGPGPWHAAKLRYAGWIEEIKTSGLKPGPVVEGDWSAESGFNAANELIANHWGEFTAVVAANDQMALGALRAFEEKGIDVPSEMSIVGFDDIPEAGFFGPPLSTVKQDFAMLGSLSLRCLMNQVNPELPPPATYTVRPTFVERKSAIPPAKRKERTKPSGKIVS
jgi:DNA-binding LacI/PurR family transcriptional regulator